MLFFKTNKKKKGLPLGWSGNYKTWSEASAVTEGYDQSEILEKVKSAVLKVKMGEAAYERDSVIFDKPEYSWGLLAILLKLSIEQHNELNIIDFGGSLGSTYFQNRQFLSGLNKIQWNIVEQKHFVEAGNKFVADKHLRFYSDLELCVRDTHSSILLASSVIQYLEDPKKMIEEIISLKFKYIVFDRTAFIDADEDRITVQRVPPEIYNASYPSWFFNYKKFINLFKGYELILEFNDGIEQPITLDGVAAYWRGLLLKRME